MNTLTLDSYLVTKNDLEVQAECAEKFSDYDELLDCQALSVDRTTLIDYCVSVSEDHLIYRVDVYQLSDDNRYYDNNSLDDLKTDNMKTIEQFYLVEKTELVAYLANRIMKCEI